MPRTERYSLKGTYQRGKAPVHFRNLPLEPLKNLLGLQSGDSTSLSMPDSLRIGIGSPHTVLGAGGKTRDHKFGGDRGGGLLLKEAV